MREDCYSFTKWMVQNTSMQVIQKQYKTVYKFSSYVDDTKLYISFPVRDYDLAMYLMNDDLRRI